MQPSRGKYKIQHAAIIVCEKLSQKSRDLKILNEPRLKLNSPAKCAVGPHPSAPGPINVLQDATKSDCLARPLLFYPAP